MQKCELLHTNEMQAGVPFGFTEHLIDQLKTTRIWNCTTSSRNKVLKCLIRLNLRKIKSELLSDHNSYSQPIFPIYQPGPLRLSNHNQTCLEYSLKVLLHWPKLEAPQYQCYQESRAPAHVLQRFYLSRRR